MSSLVVANYRQSALLIIHIIMQNNEGRNKKSDYQIIKTPVSINFHIKWKHFLRYLTTLKTLIMQKHNNYPSRKIFTFITATLSSNLII